MSVVAAAVVGVGALEVAASSYAAKKGSDASEAGARRASDATVQSTELQIAELQRQFDTQMQILQPMIQQQYAAGAAYSDLLGLGGSRVPGPPQQAGAQQNAPGNALDLREVQPGSGAYRPGGGQPRLGNALAAPGSLPEAQLVTDNRGVPSLNQAIYDSSPAYRRAWNRVRDEHFEQFGRDFESTSSPGFIENRLRQYIQEDPQFEGYDALSRIQAEADYRARPVNAIYPEQGATQFTRGPQGQFIDPNLDPTRLAGDSLRGDEYFNYITNNGQGVYGSEFRTSPGYEFARSEADRAIDRKNSQGGANYGGRAMKEAIRYADGIADQEYYRWAAGRERDLTRGGRAAENFLVRQATDLQRSDTGYYNFLANTARAAGFGNSAGQAVQSADNLGRATASAYGAQGNALANIAVSNADNQGNIAVGNAANINNALQKGVENYLTYRGTKIPNVA